MGKSKNLAFKGIEEEIEDSEDESEVEDEDEDEDLTFIANVNIKLFQGKRIRTNLLGNLNPLGRVRVRNPSSSPMSAKVSVI